SAADSMGKTLDSLLAETYLFIHGSTVVDNTIFTRDGAKVGLLSTEGFEDTILVTRGAYGRWGGLTEDGIKHIVKTERAAPLVEAASIVGAAERVDAAGEVVWALDTEAVEQAVKHLTQDRDVDASAVSRLWSFANDSHEQAIKDIVARVATEAYC